ncbi:hypothetical protein [Neolewinella sp.]|uniref:hypothetical protein n=1 Tax=Neolewinella sp. TaxID=2993543 RepID=UPI003B5209A3
MKILASGLPLLILLFVSSCGQFIDGVVTSAISADESEVVAADIAKPMPGDPHGIMTELQPELPGDRERADNLAAEIKQGIARYRDIELAQGDGYEFFPADPPPHMHIVHLVNQQYAKDEADGFDPSRPGSLLYERTHDGQGWKLIGAMITAPVTATVQDLNARVPLSQVRYHLHRNICVPKPIWDSKAWARVDDRGQPVFGPESPITTEAECAAEDGRLLETVFGWMAHAYVYADDPADTWNQMYGH